MFAVDRRRVRWSRAIIWEYYHPHPVLDIRLFKSRNFSVACMMMFMLGAALYGATVLIPQLLQTLMGYTAQQAGMVLSPGALVIIATMPLMGRMARQDGRALDDRVRIREHRRSRSFT